MEKWYNAECSKLSRIIVLTIQSAVLLQQQPPAKIYFILFCCCSETQVKQKGNHISSSHFFESFQSAHHNLCIRSLYTNCHSFSLEQQRKVDNMHLAAIRDYIHVSVSYTNRKLLEFLKGTSEGAPFFYLKAKLILFHRTEHPEKRKKKERKKETSDKQLFLEEERYYVVVMMIIIIHCIALRAAR